MGPSGSSSPVEYLVAYSVPSQPNASGSALIFDRNAVIEGTAITHSANSSDITIQKTGYYCVSVHGTISAQSGVSLPTSILLYLTENGALVVGSNTRQSLVSYDETECMAFTQIIKVDQTPTLIQVIAEGGAIFYSDLSITVSRIGDL